MIPETQNQSTPLIAVFGLFHGTNLGNEATLAALLSNLNARIGNVRFLCISPPGTALQSRFDMTVVPIETFPIARHFWRIPETPVKRIVVSIIRFLTEPIRRRRAAEALRNVDLMIVAGTGVMEDFGQGALDLPLSMLRWTRAARSVGALVAYLSVGAGPITKLLSRKWLVQAARLAHLRTFRDDFSREYMKSVGLDVARDEIVPDLAFSLPDVRSYEPTAWPPRTIGVGVMNYRGWHQPDELARAIYETYLKKISSFVAWLVQEGYQVRLLIGDTRADPLVVRDLMGRLPPGAGVHAPEINDVDDLRAELLLTDMVIATRYHNLLLALLLGRAAVSISYSQKCDALMEFAGLAQYSQAIEELDTEMLREQFLTLANTDPVPTNRVRQANAAAAEALDRQYVRVHEYLLSPELKVTQ